MWPKRGAPGAAVCSLCSSQGDRPLLEGKPSPSAVLAPRAQGTLSAFMRY